MERLKAPFVATFGRRTIEEKLDKVICALCYHGTSAEGILKILYLIACPLWKHSRQKCCWLLVIEQKTIVLPNVVNFEQLINCTAVNRIEPSIP